MFQNQRLEGLTHSRYTVENLQKIEHFLTEAKTFEFPKLHNGLFPAAMSLQPELSYTGYQNVWLRDNIHVAHMHFRIGNYEIVENCLRSLVKFYIKYEHRFIDCIAGKADPSDVMQRPHIRFDGVNLQELPEKWAHAQNDALGYLLWLLGRMIADQKMEATADVLQVVSHIIAFLSSVNYWQEEDCGHWEEAKKVEASSIGVVVAGLKIWQSIHPQLPAESGISLELMNTMIDHGQSALDQILPAECIQDDPEINRRYDAALLFLVYPLQVVSETMARQIVSDVTTRLQGDYGIKRYLGDSYWCADYKDKLAPEQRTTEFADDMSVRDALWKPDEEAQWCIFDSIISTIYGIWYSQTKNPDDLSQQIFYFHRALSQLTADDCPWGSLLGPESYFLEKGTFIPNDITPLLWTQANLRIALEQMKATASS